MTNLAEGVWTLEEIDAQIANLKAQLLAPNAGYSVSPSDGGAGRSVTRENRAQINRELTLWMRRRQALAGASTGRMRVRSAVLPRRCC